jgi:esterase/lipase
MYKHCFELQNEDRTWIIASKSEQDLVQWYQTIYNQIEQAQKRIIMLKKNHEIIKKEVEKAKIDAYLLD